MNLYNSGIAAQAPTRMQMILYPDSKVEASLAPSTSQHGLPNEYLQQSCCARSCKVRLQIPGDDNSEPKSACLCLSYPLFNIVSKPGGYRATLRVGFRESLLAWLSGVLENPIGNGVPLNIAALDNIPLSSVSPVTAQFSTSMGYEYSCPKSVRLWMVVELELTLRNVMRFRPPVVDNVSVTPLAFSPAALPGTNFNPSVVYYRTENF